MQRVFDILDNVAGTASKNEKIAILTANKDNTDLRDFLQLVYNPRLNYYIKYPKVSPPPIELGGVSSFENIKSLVELFSSRSLTGNAARVTLDGFLAGVTEPTQKLIKFILGRDVRAGFKETTINKVWPGLIPVVPYMRCNLLDNVDTSKWDWESGVFSQVKYDGMFAALDLNMDGSMSIQSRAGNPFPAYAFKDIFQVIREFPKGAQLHGELLMADAVTGAILPREIGNGRFNSLLSGDEELDTTKYKIIFNVWDMVSHACIKNPKKDEFKTDYGTRYGCLADCLYDIILSQNNNTSVLLAEGVIVFSLADAKEHYQECVKRGLEGTILKNPAGFWKDGTSNDQLKLKITAPCELRVKGFNPGEGKNAATFGSMIMASEDDLLEVGVSGFTDPVRKEIWENRDEMIGTIWSVEFNTILKPSESNSKHSLFLPRIHERRLDKKEADTLQRIQEQYDAIIKGN